MNLSQKEIEFLNSFSNFLSYTPTWDFKKFVNSPQKIIGLFTGNQRGKTAMAVYGYVLRILGKHPVPKKNVVYFECVNRTKAKIDDSYKSEYLQKHKSIDSATWIFENSPKVCPECGSEVIQHKRGSRVFRFCSETLPGQSANVNKEGVSAEVKNTQYPELKKWLPQGLIKKDITFRNPAMTIKDLFGGADIIIEFVSYNQSVQSTAGTQRMGIWLDEQPPQDFLEEQFPRLLAEDGDIIITCTPADRLTYLYDDVFEKAKVYYRTETISKKYGLKRVEVTDSLSDIAVIQAATDDNPTLSPDTIDALFEEIDDPDALAIRRYGVFKQISGRIYKAFDWNIHIIPSDKYFPHGIPHMYNHFRGIDYHEHVNWACGAMSISPQDEAFIWLEYNPSPEQTVTFDIAKELALICKDYKFTKDLIDPLANKTQSNTGMTVVEDLNRAFSMYRKENIGTGAYWQGWDTKSTRGRDEVRKRLMNSVQVGRPFNNIVVKNGKKVQLPTLWILDTCKLTAKSMKNWRLEEWVNNSQNATKEKKETPQQKWSHFNMVWECLFKDPACKPKGITRFSEQHYDRFKGERHAAV